MNRKQKIQTYKLINWYFNHQTGLLCGDYKPTGNEAYKYINGLKLDAKNKLHKDNNKYKAIIYRIDKVYIYKYIYIFAFDDMDGYFQKNHYKYQLKCLDKYVE